ncbi:MAG: hypothetical protein M1834_001932 [Cirrosporium novae-zelandiae]|nr:MAG: hypothetical protein M1834_001932 [Cirrosporium novae-zelandiae]
MSNNSTDTSVAETSTPLTSTILTSLTSEAATSTPETSATPNTPTTTNKATTPTTTAAQATTPATTAATTPTTTAQGTTTLITSVITQTPSSGGPAQATTIVITSTAEGSAEATSEVVTITSSSDASSSTSSNPAALATSGADQSSGSGGLSNSGKIAIAVVVPVVVVALLVLLGLFLWRKRKQRKDAEELRRKEMEEYGFNPNQDPTLPAVGSDYPDEPSEIHEDNSGYRGWGNTSSGRKQSTQLSSGLGGIGMAFSDGGSNPDAYGHPVSPTQGTNPSSETNSGEALMGNRRPQSGDTDGVGALGNGSGPGPVVMSGAGNNEKDIHRGPSNASSAYSAGHRSDSSGEAPIPVGSLGPDGGYYNDAMPQHGPYGDGTYGGSGQPIVRDVQARRNTRIESPSIFPQQGNAGIAQNF